MGITTVENRYELRGKQMATNQRSRVELCTDNQTGEPVVLKISDDIENLERERQFLAGADASYIVSMKDAFDLQENGRLRRCLVLEAGDEDLTAYWERRKRRLGHVEGQWIAADIALCIKYLHDQGFVHCDLKPQNVVRFYDGRWKLIDFEMVVREGQSTRGLTIGYLPPEAARAHPASVVAEKSLDMWSYGGILYEVFTGRQFLDFLPTSEAILAWLKSPAGIDLPFSLRLQDGERDLLLRLLTKNPADRPSIEEVLLHPILASAVATLRTGRTIKAATPGQLDNCLLPGMVDLEVVENLEQERRLLQERVVALGRDKARLLQDVSTLESKLNWLQQEINVLNAKVKTLEASLKKFKELNEKLDNDNFSLRKDSYTSKSARSQMEIQIRKLEAEKKQLEEMSTSFRAECDQLHARIAELTRSQTQDNSLIENVNNSLRGGVAFLTSGGKENAAADYAREENRSVRGGSSRLLAMAASENSGKGSAGNSGKGGLGNSGKGGAGNSGSSRGLRLLPDPASVPGPTSPIRKVR
mmetsp:Transcript_6063/g.9313  ORF Transcript_6063/g.9313 Transcript_6063/m.9313 type:complete len:531 (-) Transcript_6063:101-1693(-)